MGCSRLEQVADDSLAVKSDSVGDVASAGRWIGIGELAMEILSTRVLEIVGEGEPAVVEPGCSKRRKVVNVGEECVVEVGGGAESGVFALSV